MSSLNCCVHLARAVTHDGLPSSHVVHALAQGAVEVWDYSKAHLKNFEPIFEGRDVHFRHVPFSWFPLVSAIIHINHVRLS